MSEVIRVEKIPIEPKSYKERRTGFQLVYRISFPSVIAKGKSGVDMPMRQLVQWLQSAAITAEEHICGTAETSP